MERARQLDFALPTGRINPTTLQKHKTHMDRGAYGKYH